MQIDPYNKAEAVTKSDTVGFQLGLCDALQVGGAGVVAAVFQDDSVVNITAIAGQVLPIKIKRVNSTNTTATVMTALFRV
jgi:hypothetical protein